MRKELNNIAVVNNVLLGFRLEFSVHQQLQLVSVIALIVSKAYHFTA